jgi:hypothetical protein
MDDLTLLKDMARTTPLPGEEDLAPARARLLAGITAAPAAVAPRRRRGLVLSGVAVVGLAAAITGVIALGVLEPVGVAPARADAAEILHLAADAARAQPATPPRADQFVYTETRLGDGSVREAWLSADGTHDGLISQGGEDIPLPGCRDGRAAVVKGSEPLPGVTEPCEPVPAYRADLPTDAAGMREYLAGHGGKPGEVNSFGKNIHALFAETYVQPASLAALFDAIAEVDGLEVDENARDGAGRPGVGISWTVDGRPTTLVFDRQTHAFLGMTGWDSVVGHAVVDTAGLRP